VDSPSVLALNENVLTETIITSPVRTPAGTVNVNAVALVALLRLPVTPVL
jgi:hypothetical protein